MLRETRPPVPEDRPAREARRLHAAQKKQAKETAKKRAVRKAKEAEELKKLNNNIATDVKNAGKASTALKFDAAVSGN